MKYTLRAAIAALSIGSIPPGWPARTDPIPNAVFTEIPGVIAHAPAQTVPGLDTIQQRQSAQTNGQSGRRGWLFPPIGNYLNQRVG